MLAIAFRQTLDVIGATALSVGVLWSINALWNEAGRAVDRRRRRERRRIERALVARTRCRQCGSRSLIVDPPPESDGRRAVLAIADYLGRASKRQKAV
jgi:hypothetical protein